MDLDDDMHFATEARAVACAESMIEAGRDAREIADYRVYNVGGPKPYRITGEALSRKVRARLVAWFTTDGETAKRMLVGR